MKFVITLLALALFASPAMAAPAKSTAKDKDVGGPHLIGSFGNWRAYSVAEQNQSVCYMTLTAHFPVTKNSKFRRADALLTITHRPGESSKDVISYAPGFTYKALSSANMTIGKQDFDLFTSQDTAWSRDAGTDHKIALAIRSNATLTIAGSPTDKKIGSLTDKFGLKGSDEAYHAISKACDVDVVPLPTAAKPKAKAAPKAVKKK